MCACILPIAKNVLKLNSFGKYFWKAAVQLKFPPQKEETLLKTGFLKFASAAISPSK